MAAMPVKACNPLPLLPPPRSVRVLARATEYLHQLVSLLAGRSVRSLPKQTHGSGFIVDKKGIIVTNAHVVGDAQTVKVRLADGHVMQGTVCGKDDLRDLAVVKIVGGDSTPLPLVEAPLGDSTSLEIGDFVIAMGNPLGLNNTITLVRCTRGAA